MTERHKSAFLMTPRQHLQWAERARRVGRHDLAQQREQLARVIEQRRQAEAATVASPPIAPASQ
jgi:hypothetical protein